MSPVTFLLGFLMILSGFVILARRLHDRSMHESIAWLKAPGGNTGGAVSTFVGLVVPILASITAGTGVVAVGVLVR
ncbi:MAG TPA: hypothetical protein VFO58_08525 [Vicinamibacterales bacterium]|nr:hypothetical protein [Vicinamibacterales bacterium]